MAFLVTLKSETVVAETVVEFNTSSVSQVQVGINISAASGTTPTLQPYLEILGSDGVWYSVWKPTAITAVGQAVTTVGPGCATAGVFAASARLRFEVTGTTPSFTLSADVHGH